jgi:hypothetical protein
MTHYRGHTLRFEQRGFWYVTIDGAQTLGGYLTLDGALDAAVEYIDARTEVAA